MARRRALISGFIFRADYARAGVVMPRLWRNNGRYRFSLISVVDTFLLFACGRQFTIT